jgi:transcriptional regulator with XRE-family HTH domain
MSDVERYIERRKERSTRFDKEFESGYRAFEFGVMLRQARERAGVTQEAIARELRTKKSAISRIENHAEDIRLSTLEKYAKALGMQVRFKLTGCSKEASPDIT